jgi:hypothetical protein
MSFSPNIDITLLHLWTMGRGILGSIPLEKVVTDRISFGS